MKIVAIDLSDEEAERIDSIAEREKRNRKQQVHFLTLIGLEKVEAEKTAAAESKEEGAKP